MTELVLIVGGGEAGSRLARDLAGRGREVRVVEHRAAVADELRAHLGEHRVVPGDGTDPDVLDAAGIAGAAVVAAVTGSDATNLAVAHLARFQFEVPRVLARVNSPRAAWLFVPAMGVDVAVDQSALMAEVLAGELTRAEVVALLKLRLGRFALVEQVIPPGSPADGRALRDLDLPGTCTLVAVLRQGDLLLPRGGTVLRAGDEVLAMVPDEAASDLTSALLGR